MKADTLPRPIAKPTDAATIELWHKREAARPFAMACPPLRYQDLS